MTRRRVQGEKFKRREQAITSGCLTKQNVEKETIGNTAHVPHLPLVHVSVGPISQSINTFHFLQFLHNRKTINRNLSTLQNLFICYSSLSLNIYFYYSSWHLKQSPSPPFLLWFSSSPLLPPLKICLRHRLPDPLPELPDPFRARSS